MLPGNSSMNERPGWHCVVGYEGVAQPDVVSSRLVGAADAVAMAPHLKQLDQLADGMTSGDAIGELCEDAAIEHMNGLHIDEPRQRLRHVIDQAWRSSWRYSIALADRWKAALAREQKAIAIRERARRIQAEMAELQADMDALWPPVGDASSVRGHFDAHLARIAQRAASERAHIIVDPLLVKLPQRPLASFLFETDREAQLVSDKLHYDFAARRWHLDETEIAHRVNSDLLAELRAEIDQAPSAWHLDELAVDRLDLLYPDEWLVLRLMETFAVNFGRRLAWHRSIGDWRRDPDQIKFILACFSICDVPATTTLDNLLRRFGRCGPIRSRIDRLAAIAGTAESTEADLPMMQYDLEVLPSCYYLESLGLADEGWWQVQTFSKPL